MGQSRADFTFQPIQGSSAICNWEATGEKLEGKLSLRDSPLSTELKENIPTGKKKGWVSAGDRSPGQAGARNRRIDPRVSGKML